MKKTNQLKELREKDIKQLFVDLEQSNKRIAKLKFSAKFKELKNFHDITSERKKIARIWTVISEKAIEKINKEEETGEKVKNG